MRQAHRNALQLFRARGVTRPVRESRDRDQSFALGALLVFACLLAVLTSRHEPWHDELQAWRLAIDSTGLADLLRNLRYEGHPVFPFLLFRTLGLASRSWTAAVVAHALIAGGSAWVVLRYAPFTRLHRLMVVFGYYFIYEYAVIVRPYGLGMLLALAACAAWCGPRRREMTAAILLILLANTSAVGLALAIALAFGFSVDAAEGWGGGWWTRPSHRRAVLAAWAIVALVTVTVVLQILPPTDAVYRGGGGGAVPSQGSLWVFGRSLSLPARAMLPFAKTLSDGSTQWNTWLLSPTSRMEVVLTDLLAFAVVLAGALVVSRRRSALLLWVVGCFGFIAFFTLFHPGAARHHGYITVVFITAVWLAFSGAPTPWSASVARVLGRLEPLRIPAFTLLLLPMLGAALQLARADGAQQFANASEIVALLRRDHLLDLPIVGASYPWSQPVAALLDRPIALPIEGRSGTWVDAGRVRHDRPARALIDSTVEELSTVHCQVIVLTDSDTELSPWLRAQLRRVSAIGVTPMSGRAVAVWLATAPRCAGTVRQGTEMH